MTACGISTKFLPENPDEFYHRRKLLLQEYQAGKISDIIDGDIVARKDKVLEYKCKSTKQHKFLPLKNSN